ncbi:MAG: complex I NDUFA9 subunit family protein [Hyphomicrobiales bacterium]|nr:complex I NDUFA9 subunit family protein [Hyphomicrobiales bacterium]
MAELAQSTDRLVTVFGASGFLGRHVTRALAKDGWRIRAACRRPDLAFHLQPLGRVGQIAPIQANVRYPESVAAAIAGADAVVNLVGVLAPHGRQSFEAVHAFGANAIAKAAAAAGVDNLVHVSAIGADASAPAVYASSKGRGEQAMREHVPGVNILRPSVVFGPEDAFFNRFAAIARAFPVVPVVGGATKFQPVFVGDVASAVARLAGGAARGATYELGGPEVLPFRDIVQWICDETGRKRLIANLPFGAGRAMALGTEIASAVSLGLYPSWLTTTRDQVEMLRNDNVVSADAITDGRTLEGLGITPESFRAVAPNYLWRFRATGQFNQRKMA